MQLSKLNILYIEPYYTGSHKQWINSYKRYSKHNIEILKLSGQKWKWRMHGGAVTLAYEFNKLNKNFDIILCSDMLNLPVFKSLCNYKIESSKVVMYFHENQLSYPWSPQDDDLKLNRDLHYHFINYTSSLVSDHNYFNSQYHLDSYMKELLKYLKKMPDFRNEDTLDEILVKSSILPIGCELKINKSFVIKAPIILWNHRWEYDKNPEMFFNVLFDLNDRGINFSLIVVGQKYKEYPDIFNKAKKKLKNNILHFGYCESNEEYLHLIKKSNILPVTSYQDFFGISIVEAVSNGNYPILPTRLSYPELFDFKNNSDLFYNNKSELKNKLINIINNIENIKDRVNNLSDYVFEKYSWMRITEKYDSNFIELVSN